MLNPLPLMFAWVIVRLALPVLLICTDCELVAPATTLEKLTLPGVAARLPCVPEPVTLTEVVCPWVFTIETEPLRALAAAGLYCTLSVALCKGASVSGVLMPLAVTLVPLTPI